MRSVELPEEVIPNAEARQARWQSAVRFTTVRAAMKITHTSFAHSLLVTARLGLAGAFAAAALTAAAQSTSSSNATQTTPRTPERGTQTTPRAPERASERAQERASSRSAVHGQAGALTKADQKFVEKFTESNRREMALARLGLQRATNPQVRQFAQKLVNEHQMITTEFMAVVHGEANAVASASASGSGALRGSTETMDHDSATSEQRDRTATEPVGVATGERQTGDRVPRTDAAGRAVNREVSSSSASASADPATTTARDRDTGALASRSSMSGSAMATGDMSNDRHVRALMDKKQGEDFDKAFVKRMVKEHEEAVKLLEKATEDKDHGESVRAFANKHLPALRDHLRQAKQIEDTL